MAGPVLSRLNREPEATAEPPPATLQPDSPPPGCGLIYPSCRGGALNLCHIKYFSVLGGWGVARGGWGGGGDARALLCLDGP